MDGAAFEVYIRDVLAPELRPGTVVICDNLATHCDKAAAETLRDVGCWFLYLPRQRVEIQRPQGIQASFDWQAAYDSRAGQMCSITLINDIATY